MNSVSIHYITFPESQNKSLKYSDCIRDYVSFNQDLVRLLSHYSDYKQLESCYNEIKYGSAISLTYSYCLSLLERLGIISQIDINNDYNLLVHNPSLLQKGMNCKVFDDAYNQSIEIIRSENNEPKNNKLKIENFIIFIDC